jgi:hypothetical protein
VSTRLNNLIVGGLSGALIGSVPGWLINKARGAAVGAAIGAAGLGLVGFLSGSNGSSGTGTAGLPMGLGRALFGSPDGWHEVNGKRVYVSGDKVFADGRWHAR